MDHMRISGTEPSSVVLSILELSVAQGVTDEHVLLALTYSPEYQ